MRQSGLKYRPYVYDLVTLSPCFFAISALVYGFTENYLGATNDLIWRLYITYLLAWLLAVIAARVIAYVFRWQKPVLTFLRALAVILIFFPLYGATIPIAEEWTIQSRKATWPGPSDMGYTYMYVEMSGMGYADGLSKGWENIWNDMKNFIFWGVLLSPLWFPLLVLSTYFSVLIWPGEEDQAAAR